MKACRANNDMKSIENRCEKILKDVKDITEALGAIKTAIVPTEKFSVVFMFPGQSNQYPYMAYQLYQKILQFKQTIDQCDKIVKAHLAIDVKSLLFSDLSESLLNRTTYIQPALFIVEYALAQLLIHYGIKPSVLIGHSLGEYAAACLAEVFALEDALSLVIERGRLMEQTSPGKVLVIACNINEFKNYQKFFPIELAAHNTDNQCVATGDIDGITKLMTYLKEQGKQCQLLNVNHAFHSRSMESIYDSFYAIVGKVQLHPPKLPVISNLTGNLLTSDEATDPHYWYQHLRSTVQFKKSLDVLVAQENLLFIEVGPGQVLGSMLSPTIPKIHTLPSTRLKGSDFRQLLTVLGFAWQHGIKINWQTFHTIEQLI